MVGPTDADGALIADTPSLTPPLEPLRSPHRLRFLDDEQLDRLQDATLRILEDVGVRFPSETALEILGDHGAKVDRSTQIVRFPRDLVRRALSTAPRQLHDGGPGSELRPPARGGRQLLHDRWLRRGDDRLRHPAGATVAQERRRRDGPDRRLPAVDRVHVADGERPGPRPDVPAPRDRRGLQQHGQALPGDGHGRRAGPSGDRDGDRPRRQPRVPPRATRPVRPHLLDRPARPGSRRPGGGPRLRRGRDPGRVPVDAHARDDGSGDLGRRPGRRRRRGHLGDRPAPAGLPGRARLPLDHEGLGGPADRQLRRLLPRQPGALRSGRDGPPLGTRLDGRLLRHGLAARPARGRPLRRSPSIRSWARWPARSWSPGSAWTGPTRCSTPRRSSSTTTSTSAHVTPSWPRTSATRPSPSMSSPTSGRAVTSSPSGTPGRTCGPRSSGA